MLGNQTFEVLQPLSKFSRQGLKVFEFVGMFSINKYSRNFKPGIPLSKDFRNDVIQMAAMRPISEICRRYRTNRSTVHKYTNSISRDNMCVQYRFRRMRFSEIPQKCLFLN